MNSQPSYYVNFDRLATTGFEMEWMLREGIRDIADELWASNSPMVTT